MTYNYRSTLVLIILILSSFFSKAQNTGSIQDFTILPKYLNSLGKVLINRNAATTKIEYTLNFARRSITTTPKYTWEPVNIAVALSTGSANGSQLFLFNQPTKFTNNDFKGNDVFLKDVKFTAIIDNSKLSIGNPLIIAYTVNDTSFPILGYGGKSYSIEFISTPVDPPVIDPNGPYQGSVIVNNWILNNKLEHKLALEGGVGYTPGYGYIESQAFRAFAENWRPAESVPVYAFSGSYGKGIFSNLYGTGRDVDPFWVYNGIAFYAFNYQYPGTVPVYCYTAPDGRNHYFSINNETDPYWRNKYLAFYAFPLK